MKDKLYSILIDEDTAFLELFESVYETIIRKMGGVSHLITATGYTDYLLNERCDLFFLDIKMSELSGFEISRMIPSSMKIVYVSSHEHYVFQAFDFRPYGFIRKRHLRFDLTHLLQRYFSECSEIIEIPVHGRILPINIKRIWMVNVNGNYTTVHYDNTEIRLKISLNRFEKAYRDQLRDFVHISRHMIVNMNYIKCISEGQVITINNHSFYISRGFVSHLKEKYYTFLNR